MATSSLSGQDLQSFGPNGQSSSPQPPPSSTTVSRRLPPPCWSPDETVALIDAYCDKWYSLRRGNLRATHWQEVADAVAIRCPVDPAKTSVQCRHKMEKLRKRYRAELQRAYATPSGRYCSSWVHFKRMDSMEKGPTAEALPLTAATIDHDEDDEEEYDGEDQEDLFGNSVKHGAAYNNRSFYPSMNNGIGGGGGAGNGFRIRIPGRSNMGPSVAKSASKYDEIHNYNVNPNFNLGTTSKVVKDGYTGKYGFGKRIHGDGVGKRKEGDAVGEMVAAVKVLGDGFVKMERMKMEMAREVEAMRMEMEMKRTEMILESQQRIVEAFVKAFSEKSKKVRRMPTSES